MPSRKVVLGIVTFALTALAVACALTPSQITTRLQTLNTLTSNAQAYANACKAASNDGPVCQLAAKCITTASAAGTECQQYNDSLIAKVGLDIADAQERMCNTDSASAITLCQGVPIYATPDARPLNPHDAGNDGHGDAVPRG